MSVLGYLKVMVTMEESGKFSISPLDRPWMHLVVNKDHIVFADNPAKANTPDTECLKARNAELEELLKAVTETRDEAVRQNEKLAAKNSELLDIIERLTGTIRRLRRGLTMQRMKEKRDMDKSKEITIDVKTRGMEEAHEQIEALADAYDGFPAQVNIKGARDCVFNIYPSQTKIIGMDSDPEGGDGE